MVYDRWVMDDGFNKELATGKVIMVYGRCGKMRGKKKIQMDNKWGREISNRLSLFVLLMFHVVVSAIMFYVLCSMFCTTNYNTVDSSTVDSSTVVYLYWLLVLVVWYRPLHHPSIPSASLGHHKECIAYYPYHA